MRRPLHALFVMLFVLLTAALYFSGCQLREPGVTDSSQPQPASLTKLSADDPAVMSVMAVQNKHTPDLMKDRNVIGTATGMTPDGRPAILVFLEKANVQPKDVKTVSSIPDNIDGIPVVVEVIGPIKALKTTVPTVSHTAKQTPPVQLGTSGGWRYDLANGYCCGGTIGSLVLKGGKQYVLSNYHVLEADIVSGGNSRVAQAGDPVIQPGLIDVSCNAANAQNVASLSGIKSLPGSNVDAAIAEVIPGMVRTDGSILEVGTISSSTVAAAVGMKVKKSGRTSGLTRTTVYALNATISVAYENECAGGQAFVKQFTGQIVFKGGKFIQSGDSGSLAVEDVSLNPRSVGLCFAGSSRYGFGNPIGQVLSYLGASMVGN